MTMFLFPLFPLDYLTERLRRWLIQVNPKFVVSAKHDGTHYFLPTSEGDYLFPKIHHPADSEKAEANQ